MNGTMRWGIVIGAGIGVAGGLFLAGCEIDSASSTIEITPDAVALYKGQSVTLTAVGGYEYTWSMATETWGFLNTRKGNQVVYTSLYSPAGETPVVQVITVDSKFTTMSGVQGYSADVLGAGTNVPSTSAVQTAYAYITHLPIAVTSSVSM